MGLLDDAIREHLDLKRRRGADPTEIERAEREALGPVRREPSMSAALAGESAAAVSPDIARDGADFAFAPESDEFAGDAPTTVSGLGERGDRDAEAPAGIAAPHYADPDFDDLPAVDPPPTSVLPELEPLAPAEPQAEPAFEPLPEPEPKPKRRHLFGRHRHDDEEERPPLPAELPDDDPFADAPAAHDPLGDDSFEDDPFADEPPVGGVAPAEPIETIHGEAVGRAQPIQREQPPAPPTLRITPEGEPGNTVEYDVEEAFREEDGSPISEDDDILEETPDFLADTPDHDRLWFEQKPPPDFDFDN